MAGYSQHFIADLSPIRLRIRAILARDLCCKPFDVRFAAILENMIAHSKFFELEIKVAHSTSLFREFDDLHAKFRAAEHRAEILERERTEEETSKIKRGEEEAFRKRLVFLLLIYWIHILKLSHSAERRAIDKMDQGT